MWGTVPKESCACRHAEPTNANCSGCKSADVLMEFKTADVRDMSNLFASSSFDVVLDKGTLDALLCADDADGNARRMTSEVLRVLRPGAHE